MQKILTLLWFGIILKANSCQNIALLQNLTLWDKVSLTNIKSHSQFYTKGPKKTSLLSSNYSIEICKGISYKVIHKLLKIIRISTDQNYKLSYRICHCNNLIYFHQRLLKASVSLFIIHSKAFSNASAFAVKNVCMYGLNSKNFFSKPLFAIHKNLIC